MKSNKLTSLLCALALTGAVMPLSMAEAAEPLCQLRRPLRKHLLKV